MAAGRHRSAGFGCRVALAAMSALTAALAAGCDSPGQRVQLAREASTLREQKGQLERALQSRDADVARLEQQVRTLQTFGPDRPMAAFAPRTTEILALSGGASYDDQPGDDGITVYLRLRDSDGDPVKSPGQIRVQLLDNTDLANPAVVGVYLFTDIAELRKLWHGRFGGQHFALRCPFPPNAKLPGTGRLTVRAEFADYLSGATLTAVAEVGFHRSG